MGTHTAALRIAERHATADDCPETVIVFAAALLAPLYGAHGDDPPRWQRGAGAGVSRPCLRVAETAATRSATTPTRRGLGHCGGCAAPCRRRLAAGEAL